jgi:putative 4-mercaptohistidine N1-methyltranferase
MNEIYESDKLLAEYLLFHYGTPDEILPPNRTWPTGMHEALEFPVRTVAHFLTGHVASGLDLGCAVGRSAFEMSRTCEQVLGIDFSHAFIGAAQRIGNGEKIAYERLDEGRVTTQLIASMPDGVDASKAQFIQGDAMNLAESLGVFDRVHAANLLCRLPEPIRLLERFSTLVKAGGELVLATPCTWLEDFTPLPNWPEGSTIDWLKEYLTEGFELVSQHEEPFLIRETARKFQWTTSMVTVWRKN